MYVVGFFPHTCEIRFAGMVGRFNSTLKALNLLSSPFQVLDEVRKYLE
jgi:hypothetical protein